MKSQGTTGKTHLFKIQHTLVNWKYLDTHLKILTKLNTYQPATKRPQLSHFENFAVQDRPEQPKFVVVRDNFSFHWAALVQNWFTNYDQLQAMGQACRDTEVRSVQGWGILLVMLMKSCGQTDGMIHKPTCAQLCFSVYSSVLFVLFLL